MASCPLSAAAVGFLHADISSETGSHAFFHGRAHGGHRGSSRPTSFFLYNMVLDMINNLQKPKIDLKDRPGAPTMNEVVGNVPDGRLGPATSSSEFREKEAELHELVLGVQSRAREASHEADLAKEVAAKVMADQAAVPHHVQTAEEAWPRVLEGRRLMQLLSGTVRKVKSLEGATADFYRAFLRVDPHKLSVDQLLPVRARLDKIDALLPEVEQSQTRLEADVLDDFYQKYFVLGGRALPPPAPRVDVKYRIVGQKAFWPRWSSTSPQPSVDPLGHGFER